MPDGHPRETDRDRARRLPRRRPRRTGRSPTPAAPRSSTSCRTRTAPLYPDGQPRPPMFAAGDRRPRRSSPRRSRRPRRADFAVVVVGDTVALTGEGCSTATLELQGGQIALLDARRRDRHPGRRRAGPLQACRPAAVGALRAAAVIEAFNPGMRGGRAVAELRARARSSRPAGCRSRSPRHVGQQPVYYNQVRGQHGHRYADLTQDPQFVFGEGLSYTTVEYSDLTLDASRGRRRRRRHAPGSRLTNTGPRPAMETVQAYVSDLVTSVTWAAQGAQGVPAGGGAAGRVRRRRARGARRRRAPWSTPTAGASSSPASSSCWSAAARATPTCCEPASPSSPRQPSTTTA